jgi:hypothetical protein
MTNGERIGLCIAGVANLIIVSKNYEEEGSKYKPIKATTIAIYELKNVTSVPDPNKKSLTIHINNLA